MVITTLQFWRLIASNKAGNVERQGSKWCSDGVLKLPEKAAYGAGMAGRTAGNDLNQECVTVTVKGHRCHTLHVPTCRSLVPEFLATTAPENCLTRCHHFRQAFRGHPGHHQYLERTRHPAQSPAPDRWHQIEWRQGTLLP